MTQLTHHTPALPTPGRSVPESLPAAGAWLLGGVLAAGVGLASAAALVTLLWITSPYPDSGADGALHIAADLWLLAHGAQLVRTETLHGSAAPVGLTPLLLTVLPVCLLFRAAQHGLEDRDARGDGRGAAAVIGWVAVGYLLVGALATVYASDGPLRADGLSAALHLPLVACGVTAAAAWACTVRTAPDQPRRGAFDVLYRPRLLAALRAAGLAVALLCGGGALLVVGAVLGNADVAQATFPHLASSWSGVLAVLLLATVLLPNAAVWAASYGLGPGFTLGAGSTVGPLAVDGYPQLPHFPLFAGLPPEGPGGPLAWTLAGLLPLVAGTASGWCVARTSVPDRGVRDGAAGVRATAGTALLAACGCGAAMALLALLAGGPMGTEALARFGPDWWRTGAAALGWTLLLGTPTALTVRAWRLRSTAPPPAPFPDRTVRGERPRKAKKRKSKGGSDEWHTTAARRGRWAELRKTSEGLMSEFGPPRG